MLEFNKEMINSSSNKVNKARKEIDHINVNIRMRNKKLILS